MNLEELKEVVGQQVSSRTIDELSNELRRIEPPVFPEIEIISLGTGLSVIAIHLRKAIKGYIL